MKANYPVDLHTHTYLSDGIDSVEELIRNSVNQGIKVLALTDHDVLPPGEVQLPGGGARSITRWAKKKGLCLLRGIEFSCEKNAEDVHIIGLGCNWNTAELLTLTENIAQWKASAYQQTLERLADRGYPIALEELLQFGDTCVELDTLQKKRIFDLMAAKGYVKTWVEAKLMVRDDPELNVKREKPTAKYVIECIHRNGGIAILAHPYLIDPELEYNGTRMDRWAYIEMLIESGLDGIEVRYPYDKTTCKEKREQELLWRDIAERFGNRLFVSAGSDYHADHRKNNPNPRRLGECGLTMEEFMTVPKFASLYNEVMREG